MLSLSAGQFSLLPGGAGAAELTSATLLTPLVGSTAAAAILIWRAVTYYFYLLAGGPVFVCLLARPCWSAGGGRRVELLPEFGGAGKSVPSFVQGFRVVTGQAPFAKGGWG
jgi:hypothetical protein